MGLSKPKPNSESLSLFPIILPFWGNAPLWHTMTHTCHIIHLSYYPHQKWFPTAISAIISKFVCEILDFDIHTHYIYICIHYHYQIKDVTCCSWWNHIASTCSMVKPSFSGFDPHVCWWNPIKPPFFWLNFPFLVKSPQITRHLPKP